MKNKRFIFFMVLLWGLGQLTAAQPAAAVIKAPESVKSLDAGMDWALGAANKQNTKNGFYVVYVVEKNDDGSVHMGKHSKGKTKTLFEILYGKKQGKGLENQVAVLFRFGSGPKSRFDFRDIDLNSLHHSADLDDVPLFWLGNMGTGESVGYLETCFKRVGSDKKRKDIVDAVGIHGRGPRIFAFLKRVLTGNYAVKVRKPAAFWMGGQQSAEAAKVLLNTVYNDKSSEVRENAVFGLYLVKQKAADDALEQLARKGKDREIRKKAIFWLGQKAVKRAAEILGDVIDEEEDGGVRKAAVFALSQHPDGVSKLIKLAKTHRRFGVRKQAIFWLGQSDDPRALDTILGILKK